MLTAPSILMAGSEQDPEITDPQGDQNLSVTGNTTQDILAAWFQQPNNTQLMFFLKVADLSGVNAQTGEGLPINGIWRIIFDLNNDGDPDVDQYFVTMRKPETGPPEFTWGFVDANGVNVTQAPVDKGLIFPEEGIISWLNSNANFTGAPNGNGNPKIGDILTRTRAQTRQLVGAAGTGLLVVVDNGPNDQAAGGRPFQLQDVGGSPPPPLVTRTATYVKGGFTFSSPSQRLIGSREGQRGQNAEPEIAIDFAGNTYIAAIQGVPAGTDFWRSKDGGNTFQFLGQPDGTQNPKVAEVRAIGLGGGDCDVAVSSGGYVYVSSLWLGSATHSSSLDRGIDWRISQATTPVIDRQWNAAFGPLTLYMTARQLVTEGIGDRLVLTRSDDAGLTFGPQRTITTPGVPPDPRRQGNLAVDKFTGALHNVFTPSQRHELWYWTSTDGGETFQLGRILEGAPGFQTDNVFPVIAVDNAGNLHAAFSNKKDIFLMSSPAGLDHTLASSWLAPVRVNDGVETQTALMPWIDAGDAGRVVVTWYGTDRLGDPDNETVFAGAEWRVYFAETTDALANAPTFTQVVASSPEVVHKGSICTRGLACDLAMPPGDRDLLEYYTIAVDNEGLANIIYTTDENTPNGLGRINFTKQTSGTLAIVPSPPPEALTFGTSVEVDPTRIGAEPSIDVDSKGNIFVGAIRGGAKLWKSSDNGKSFRFIQFFDLDQRIRGGDVDMSIDRNDLLYLVDLTIPRAAVHKSFDAGETFPQRVFTGELNDRPWLATFGPTTVYFAYHDLTIETIIVEKSTDGGLTWMKNFFGISDPRLLAETVPNTIDGQVVVDRNDGTVYVIFCTSDNLANLKKPPFGNLSNVYLAVSRDGGQTYENFPVFRGWVETVDPIKATLIGITPERGTNAGSIFPIVALDNEGDMYAVWASNNTRNPEMNFDEFSVWFSRSTDKGKTWSPPIQVNHDRGTHVFPWIVAGDPGRVSIGWYGTSAIGNPNEFALNDPNVRWDVFVANSLNALDVHPSFSQVKVNADRSPIHTGSISTGGLTGTADRTLLDFFEINRDGKGMTHVAWADNFNPPGTPATLDELGEVVSGRPFVIYSGQVAGPTLIKKPEPVVTFLECDHPAITRFGGWHDVQDERATNGHYCRNVGGKKEQSRAFLEFKFTGNSVDMQVARGPRGGNAEVLIDGISRSKVDFFRPPSDPANLDNSGKKDLTFGEVESFATGPGDHTFRLNVLNDTPESAGSLRDMIYVDGFLITEGTSDGTGNPTENSVLTQGSVAALANVLTGATQTVTASGSTVLLTGVLEVDGASNLDLVLLDPLGGIVNQSETSNPTEVIRATPATVGLHTFVVTNKMDAESPYRLYLVTTEQRQGATAPSMQKPALVQEDLTFRLQHNYPNPFNPQTHFNYSIPEVMPVRLVIYGVLGQIIRVLVDEVQVAGEYTVMWDGRDKNGMSVGSGVYFYELWAGKYVEKRKMIMVK